MEVTQTASYKDQTYFDHICLVLWILDPEYWHVTKWWQSSWIYENQSVLLMAIWLFLHVFIKKIGVMIFREARPSAVMWQIKALLILNYIWGDTYRWLWYLIGRPPDALCACDAWLNISQIDYSCLDQALWCTHTASRPIHCLSITSFTEHAPLERGDPATLHHDCRHAINLLYPAINYL